VPNSRAACPDYTCNPCKFDEKCPPVNFTGITSIICSYKYDVCDRLRVEHRACRKAQARMCRPVEKQVKTVCTKEVNRAWTKKCKEDEEKLDAGLKDLMAQLDALRALKPGNCGCAAPEPPPETYTQESFTCGSDGEVTLKPDAIGGGEVDTKGGWFGGGSDSKKEKKNRRGKSPNPVMAAQLRLAKLRDTTADLLVDDEEAVTGVQANVPEMNLEGLNSAMSQLDDNIAALEDLILQLQKKKKEKAKKCSAPPEGTGMERHVLNHCLEVEETERLSERHEEKCAKKTADLMAHSAKLEALIYECDRRMALLDALQEHAEGVVEAYGDVNITSTAFALLGHSFLNANFTDTTRNLIDGMMVNETSLCAEVLPTLQSSVLGLGISKDQIWCPTPTGTFIGGRDLPDWAPHFLVGVGVVLGFFVSAFVKATPAIYAVMCDHPVLFVVLGVVVLAGRFA